MNARIVGHHHQAAGLVLGVLDQAAQNVGAAVEQRLVVANLDIPEGVVKQVPGLAGARRRRDQRQVRPRADSARSRSRPEPAARSASAWRIRISLCMPAL